LAFLRKSAFLQKSVFAKIREWVNLRCGSPIIPHC
jgi:hypothetical protein